MELFEKELSRIMGAEVEENKLIDQKIDETYAQVRKLAERKRKRKLQKRFAVIGSAAAILCISLFLGVTNPVLAKENSWFGGIIAHIKELCGFQNIPDEEIVVLEPEATSETEASSENVADNQVLYQKSGAGYTITLTDYYATNQALFLGLSITGDEPLPILMADRPGHFGNFAIGASLEYFIPDTGEIVEGGGFFEFMGEQKDDYTVEGIIRIGKEEFGVDFEMHEEMEVSLAIEYFWVATESEGKINVRNHYEFPLIHINKSLKNVQTMEVNEHVLDDVWLEKIDISPAEITVYVTGPGNIIMPILLDKNGERVKSFQDVRVFSTSGYDVSEVTLYLCEWDTFMDLKAIIYGENPENKTFAELLDQYALYKKEMVPFEKKE